MAIDKIEVGDKSVIIALVPVIVFKTKKLLLSRKISRMKLWRFYSYRIKNFLLSLRDKNKRIDKSEM